MLLTIAWGGSLFLGRCDLDSNGEAIEETGKGINCRKQVMLGLVFYLYLVVECNSNNNFGKMIMKVYELYYFFHSLF